MFGKKAKDAQVGGIDCLISAKTRIQGDIQFDGGLRVDGKIIGNLSAVDAKTGTLVLSEQGVLEGEVRVAHAVINGTIVGTVHVHERVELQSKARITGDMYYRTLEMHPGAVVDGRLVHADPAAGAGEPST